jgi:phage terminase large subunit-like protein
MPMRNAQALLALPYEQMVEVIRRWTRKNMADTQSWNFWARDDQAEPLEDWRIWLVMAGRGYGKTRMGAEWVSALAAQHPGARFALVGATLNEARAVMVEATATLFSGAEPESLRGPQHDFAWADEIAKWPSGIAAWDNLMLGLRLGDNPRAMATTTPRPVPLVRRLDKEKGVAVTRGRTIDNGMNLPPDFIASVRAMYAGTRLGRQELDGELIADADGALWSRDLLERQRAACAPELKRVVIGVDPPVSENGDACGIVAVGLGVDKNAYVLADHSISGASPERWARAVAAAADAWQADRVVVEDNQGGNMVETVLRAADIAMPIKRAHASRSKSARAEPISILYEAGRVFHINAFQELEDQMCGLIAGGGYAGPGRSPDRADALVWALTELMLGKAERVPQVRLL